MAHFSEDEIQNNRKQLFKLQKLSYKDICEMEKKVLNNPHSRRIDILNLIIARSHKEDKLHIPSFTSDEVMKELLGENYIEEINFFTNCKKRITSN